MDFSSAAKEGLIQNVRISDDFGQTPLSLALEKGFLELAEQMVKAGADVAIHDVSTKITYCGEMAEEVGIISGKNVILTLETYKVEAGTVVDDAETHFLAGAHLDVISE